MAKAQRPDSGKDSPDRRTMQIPGAWYSVINRIRSKTKQPQLWIVLELVAKQADEMGIAHPPLPWEEDDE